MMALNRFSAADAAAMEWRAADDAYRAARCAADSAYTAAIDAAADSPEWRAARAAGDAAIAAAHRLDTAAQAYEIAAAAELPPMRANPGILWNARA